MICFQIQRILVWPSERRESPKPGAKPGVERVGVLLDFGADQLEPTIGGNHYLTFAMRFLLVFGFSFLFPVFLFAAAAIGVVGWRTLARGRRWAVLAIVTIGAVVTPSGDPLTLLLLSAPLYILYEADIWLIRFLLRR